MDIQVASNFERYLHDVAGGDGVDDAVEIDDGDIGSEGRDNRRRGERREGEAAVSRHA